MSPVFCSVSQIQQKFSSNTYPYIFLWGETAILVTVGKISNDSVLTFTFFRLSKAHKHATVEL